MRRQQVICVGFLSLVCGVFPAAAMGADLTTTATFSPDAVEGGFKLQGSHGYLISVVWDSKEQSDAFMRNRLLPALPVEGGFAGAPEERTAEVAHHDSL